MICEYKVIIKGKMNACYAFFGSMPAFEGIFVYEERGSDAEYFMRIGGECKYKVDAYCNPWTGTFPVHIPDDPEEAYEAGQKEYSFRTVQERSKMFMVEVLCNSADIDDFDPDEGPIEVFEHYINGEDVGVECPDILHIEVESDPWDD